MEKTLFAVDELSGFVLAVRLRPARWPRRHDAEVGQEEAQAAQLRRRRQPRRAPSRRRGARGRLRRASSDRDRRAGRAARGADARRAGAARRRDAVPGPSMAGQITIVVLEGDETGQELLEQSLRVLDPSVLGLDLELVRFDLSLENRRVTSNQIVTDAAAGDARRRARPEGGDDHPRGGRRRRLAQPDPSRTGRRKGDRQDRSPTPGRHTDRRRPLPDLGGADGRRGRLWRRGVPRGRAGLARARSPTERNGSRVPSAARVAEYAFRTAERMDARVYGGPKWTVSPVYEGDVQGGDGPGGPTPSCGRVSAGADRRHVCRPAVRAPPTRHL